MDRILIGLIVGAAFTSTIAIINSKSYLLWQKVVLGILIIFVPAQWVLAIIFYFINNFVDNNPKIKSTTNSFLDNFKPVDKNATSNTDNSITNASSHKHQEGFDGSNPYSKNN